MIGAGCAPGELTTGAVVATESAEWFCGGAAQDASAIAARLKLSRKYRSFFNGRARFAIKGRL
jgi:hypothetical protein